MQFQEGTDGQWYFYLLQADQVIQEHDDTKEEDEEEHFEYITDDQLTEAKMEVIDNETYTCNIDDLQQLPDGTIVATPDHYNLNLDAIRQIQDAKIEIQQDDFKYTISGLNDYKSDPVYVESAVYDQFASEVSN